VRVWGEGMDVRIIRLFDRYILGALIPPAALFSWFTKKQKEQKNASANDAYQKILMIKLWAIGDSILTLPMIRELKKKYPKAQIDVLCHERNKDVYTENKDLANVLLFSIKQVWKLYQKYDLVIDTEPYFHVSALIAAWTGTYRAGFAHQFRSMVYNSKTAFRKDQHMVQNYTDMLKFLGITPSITKLIKIESSSEAKARVKELVQQYQLKQKDLLIGISPGVAESVKSRMWPLQRMAYLADRLVDELHAKIIFLDSPSNAAHVDEVIKKMTSMKKDKRVINLAGKTNLKETLFLMTGIPVFISNDTGPVHMAAAQACKTLGLYGPNIPTLWAPYGKGNIVLYHKVHCSPCIINDKGKMPECIYKGTDQYQMCMKRIEINDAFDAAKELVEAWRAEQNQQNRRKQVKHVRSR